MLYLSMAGVSWRTTMRKSGCGLIDYLHAAPERWFDRDAQFVVIPQPGRKFVYPGAIRISLSRCDLLPVVEQSGEAGCRFRLAERLLPLRVGQHHALGQIHRDDAVIVLADGFLSVISTLTGAPSSRLRRDSWKATALVSGRRSSESNRRYDPGKFAYVQCIRQEYLWAQLTRIFHEDAPE